MIEVERKYRLTAAQADLIKRKIDAKCTFNQEINQIDTIYLKGMSSFDEFVPGMPVVRIRTEDESSKLTYKRSINEAGDSVEHELTIGDPAEMNDILLAEDYRVATRVAKKRVEYKEDEVTYALDDVEGLGAFIEIEIIADDNSALSAYEAKIESIALSLGLSGDMIESKKYDRLMSEQPK